MKLNGISIAPPEPRTIVIPHGDSEIILRYQAVHSFDGFTDMCKRPEPPEIIRPGNRRDKDYSDAEYQKAMNDYNHKRAVWLYLKALEINELQFDTVDIRKPDTYLNFDKEFLDAGVPMVFLDALKQSILDFCGFNPGLIEEATNRFLAMRALEKESTSLSSEQPSS